MLFVSIKVTAYTCDAGYGNKFDSTNASADSQPTIGHLLVDCRLTRWLMTIVKTHIMHQLYVRYMAVVCWHYAYRSVLKLPKIA